MRDLVWKKEDAIKLITLLEFEEIGILGGDVYRIEANSVIPMYDNWSCEIQENERKIDFFSRSKLIAYNYINNYSVSSDENIVFSIVFTEILD
jgi:hypothetical protein